MVMASLHSNKTLRQCMRESVLFFYQVACKDRTQVIRLGDKYLYPLKHLTGPGHPLYS